MKLAALQEWMQEAIVHQRTPLDVERRVQPSATLDPTARLRVYSSMYLARLQGVLANDFPALQYALGAPRFAAGMRAYLLAHPPQHPNLNQLGARLPAFLAARPRGRFYAELAALERAIQDVFDGPEAAPLRAETLAALAPEAWERTPLPLVPAAALLATEYPVNRYYQAFREQRQPRRPPRAHSWTLLWRRDYRVWRQDLNRAQCVLLQALHGGAALGAAIAAATAADPSAVTPAALRSWFQNWSGGGVFRGPGHPPAR